MMATTHLEYSLGTGVLSWNSGERISDRYGSVIMWLATGPRDDAITWVPSLAGKSGMLRATVVEVRRSDHVGDLFRDIKPGGAVLGETLDLGHGRVFMTLPKRAPAYQCVGVEPIDGRNTDWLDPHKLYRIHECVVRLTFTPDVPA